MQTNILAYTETNVFPPGFLSINKIDNEMIEVHLRSTAADFSSQASLKIPEDIFWTAILNMLFDKDRQEFEAQLG